MKVTALIPDELISQVKKYARRETITESITIALEEWLRLKKIKELNQNLEKEPLEFAEGVTATKLRSLSRRK